ncbi:MAG: ribonuclease III family protein [Clostridia bacterium]|nr:ribonuclease III family protein [Clostridia bacterium]
MKREEFLTLTGKVEKIIGYTFGNKALLVQAFTRTSYCNEHRLRGKPPFQSNEVLEFFGDGVLSLGIITTLLNDKTKKYEFGISTELGEGDFSNIKSKLSDKKNLSASTFALGLEKYLIMGEGDEKLGIENEPSVAEDLFESIIGAVYIDTGLDMKTVMKVIAGMLDTSAYTAGTSRGSAKGALQEFCADKKRRLPAPEYKTVSESGPDHKKVYERAVYIGGELIATGKGKNLKLADAECAEAALKLLTEKESVHRKKQRENKTPAKKKKSEAPESKQKKTPSVSKERKRAYPDPTGSSQKLRELSAREKKTAPLYRDLGQNGSSGEYRVECAYSGITAIGCGRDRREARELSSYEVLNAIKRIKK